MAGDWLKVEHATPDKPEVYQIAEELELDPENVFAKIVRIWIWFDIHSEDGTAPVTLRALLDRKAGVTNFTIAMENAGWLEEIEVDGRRLLFLPNFDRHVGKSAKKRALTARRVAAHKEGSAKSNAPSVTSANDASVRKALPREEKRREDISTASSSRESAAKSNAPSVTNPEDPAWLQAAREANPKLSDEQIEQAWRKFQAHKNSKQPNPRFQWIKWIQNEFDGPPPRRTSDTPVTGTKNSDEFWRSYEQSKENAA